MANLPSNTLLNIFKSHLSNDADFKQLNIGKNPCHFMYGEREFYAYIKNISPSYFKPGEDDVWRVQLTGVNALQEIKESEATFVLIGYDDVNDVFATWNPYIVKQRIGTSSSPSFYSRLSVQNEVASGDIECRKLDLNNEQEVLIFKASFLPQYLADVDVYFDDEDYVAMGSKKRPEANEAFRIFCDRKYLESFANSQYGIDLDTATIRDYVKKGLLSKFKKYFLKYDSIKDYKLAIAELSEKHKFDDEIEYNILSRYVDYQEGRIIDEESEPAEEEIDWEAKNVDDDGKLLRITNPRLVEQLKDYMYDSEYPQIIPAMNAAKNFYGDRFPNMSFADWSKAINNIVWDIEEAKRLSIGGVIITNRETGKRRMFVINGKGPFNLRRFVLEAVKTFISFYGPITYRELKEVFPERSSCNDFFITAETFAHLRKDRQQRYFHNEEEILTDSEGLRFYVSNQWKADYALKNVMPILTEYGITWEEVIANDSQAKSPSPRLQPGRKHSSRSYAEAESEPIIKEPSDLAEPLPADDYPQAATTRSSAQRLRVTFADGRVVQETTAAATLAQVVRIIGVDLVAMVVEEKKLRCCRVPILSKEWSPRYRDRQKRVGGGWLLMTNSSTESKIEFLETVSDELGLKLRIEPTT